MASHLPKIQENIFKRKEIKKNTFDYRGQDGTHCKCENIKSSCSHVESTYLLIHVKKSCKSLFHTVAACFVSGTLLCISLLQLKLKSRHI